MRTRPLPHPVARLAVLAALVLTVLLAGSPAADAHAYLDSSNPGDGATLQRAPHELRLSFSEHVVLGATRISMVDGDGDPVRVTHLRLVTEDPGDTEEPAEIVGTLPALSPNSYRISWETLSSDDLHRTAGLLVFGVQRQVSAAGLSESLPRPAEAALRLLVLLGTGLALGGPLAARVLHAPVATAPFGAAVRGSARLGLGGAVLAATAAVLLLTEQLVAGGLSPDALLSSAYGTRWAVREAGLLALVLAGWCAVRRVAPRARRLLLVAGAACATAGTALLGHAGAGTRLDPTRVVATAAHLAAALTWAGAVAVLALAVVLPGWRRPGGTVQLRAALRRFGLPAAACVTVMVVTGVLLASDVVGSVDAALRTFYGRTMLVKLALAGAAGLSAVANHRHVRGARDLDLPRRTVGAEALLVLGVLAATAVLTSSQPATEHQLVRDADVASPGPVAGQVGDLQESAGLRPNRPGRNVAIVDVFDTRRPAPAPILGVDVAIGTAAPVAAAPLSDGHWSAPVSDVASGGTRLTVTVHRQGVPDVVSHQRWVVGADPGATLPAVVSTAPVRSPLRLLAGALAVLCLLGWATALGARRRRAVPGEDGAEEPDPEDATDRWHPSGTHGPFRSPPAHPLGTGVSARAEVD